MHGAGEGTHGGELGAEEAGPLVGRRESLGEIGDTFAQHATESLGLLDLCVNVSAKALGSALPTEEKYVTLLQQVFRRGHLHGIEGEGHPLLLAGRDRCGTVPNNHTTGAVGSNGAERAFGLAASLPLRALLLAGPAGLACLIV